MSIRNPQRFRRVIRGGSFTDSSGFTTTRLTEYEVEIKPKGWFSSFMTEIGFVIVAFFVIKFFCGMFMI